MSKPIFWEYKTEYSKVSSAAIYGELILSRGGNSLKIVLPLLKMVLKGNNLIPKGTNSFFIENTPFQKVLGAQNSQTGSHKGHPPKTSSPPKSKQINVTDTITYLFWSQHSLLHLTRPVLFLPFLSSLRNPVKLHWFLLSSYLQIYKTYPW